DGKTPEQATLAEAKAKDVVARARKGEKFTDLVRENSDDPETAKNGGQLPPYERGMMVPQLENIVWNEANKKGYVTDPIKTGQGYVILKIEERFAAGQASFEEVKEMVRERLSAPKMDPKIREYLTRLREEAYLQIKDGYVDTGAAPGKDTRWKDVAQLKPQTTTKEEVAARRKRHLLWVVPAGSVKEKQKAPVAAPAKAPTGTGAATEKPADKPAEMAAVSEKK